MLEARLQIRHTAQELHFVLLQRVLPLGAPIDPVIADVLQLLADLFLRGQAADSSGPALVTARANAAANGIANIDFKEADIFQLLSNYASARRHLSMVVLDPPAFAKSRRNVESATTGYKEINLRALRLLPPGGILVTCSCSRPLGESALLELVAQASLDANRTLRVLERRTQSQDHPILLTVPETLYLKCLILEVV